MMIPDFPHNIRIRLARLNFFLFHIDVALSLPCWLSQFRTAKLRQTTGQRQSNVRRQQKKINGANLIIISSVAIKFIMNINKMIILIVQILINTNEAF